MKGKLIFNFIQILIIKNENNLNSQARQIIVEYQ
jgi:hypothetical protein